jgi:hypothetical protein
VFSQRSTAETSIARQRLARRVSAAKDKHGIVDEHLGVVGRSLIDSTYKISPKKSSFNYYPK